MEVVLLIIVVATSLLLALLVYFNSPKSATNIIFSILNVVIAIWAVVNYISIHPPSQESALFWVRLTTFFAVPQGVLFLLLANTLPREKLQLQRKYFFSLLFAGVLVMADTMSPYMFTAIKFNGSSFDTVAGPGMLLFAAFMIGSTLVAIATLIKRFRSSIGLEKAQLGYMILGISLMVGLLIVTVIFPVFIFHNTYFVIYAPFYALLFFTATAYSIIRHRLLDLRLVVARAVAYTLLVLILLIFYTGAIFFISRYLVEGAVNTNQTILSALLALFIALTFAPLRKFLEKITDRIFFKTKYDSNELIFKLTKIMASTLDLENLAKTTLFTLLDTMKISGGAFIILEDHSYQIFTGNGQEKTNYNSEILQFFSTARKIFVFEEEDNDNIRQIMRNNNISIVVPLYVEEKTHGLLVMGEKKSGEVYSSQDIQVLGIFGPEISVAVQNSKAYEEIKRFNITLKEEVEKATKDLQIANTKLKELDQLKDDFVSVASHELRTPMTAVRSYVWMALNRPDIELSDKMKRYLSRTLISTERLINLVNDMLNVSRIESGRVEITPEVFDISALASDIVEDILPKAQEKRIKVDVLKTPVPQVFADEEKVEQVLLNLLGNALKFTPVEGTITISFLGEANGVDISVKDNGVGISKDDLGRLFKKFGRLDNSYVAAATSGGTGLGLYISRSLVELMGGKIWVSSEGMGKGTTFTFSLPAATKEVIAQAQKYTKSAVGGDAKALEPVAI